MKLPPNCFTATDLVSAPATLADGQTVDLHFLPLSFAAREAYRRHLKSEDETESNMAKPRLVASMLRDVDGSEGPDYLTLSKLKPEVFDSIFEAALESLAKRKKAAGEEPGKASEPGASAGSGSRSRSRSAGDRSGSGSKR